MLKGLALTPPAIGRIAIGKVVEKNGKRLPEKDDEFTITSQVQLKDGWVLHPVDEVLRKDSSAKLRSIPVRLLFGDPDLSLRAKYTLFERTTGRPLCVGDGESVTVDMEEKRLNDQGMKRTPMRHAITLLLNFPQLIEHVGNPEQFARYEVAGVDLFLMLLEIIEADPTIHTAALVERFRDTPYATALARLHGLQFNYDVESDLLVREFCDCLAQIKRQAQQKQLDQLLQNEQVNGLNPQERNDLLCLLSELHNSGA